MNPEKAAERRLSSKQKGPWNPRATNTLLFFAFLHPLKPERADIHHQPMRRIQFLLEDQPRRQRKRHDRRHVRAPIFTRCQLDLAVGTPAALFLPHRATVHHRQHHLRRVPQVAIAQLRHQIEDASPRLAGEALKGFFLDVHGKTIFLAVLIPERTPADPFRAPFFEMLQQAKVRKNRPSIQPRLDLFKVQPIIAVAHRIRSRKSTGPIAGTHHESRRPDKKENRKKRLSLGQLKSNTKTKNRQKPSIRSYFNCIMPRAAMAACMSRHIL